MRGEAKQLEQIDEKLPLVEEIRYNSSKTKSLNLQNEVTKLESTLNSERQVIKKVLSYDQSIGDYSKQKVAKKSDLEKNNNEISRLNSDLKKTELDLQNEIDSKANLENYLNLNEKDKDLENLLLLTKKKTTAFSKQRRS